MLWQINVVTMLQILHWSFILDYHLSDFSVNVRFIAVLAIMLHPHEQKPQVQEQQEENYTDKLDKLQRSLNILTVRPLYVLLQLHFGFIVHFHF